MDEKILNESIASMIKDRSKRDALAQLITEYVQPQHITTDFIGMLLNTRNLNPGDALVRKVRKGIEVRTLVPGSIHLASEITVQERMNYILDGADVKVTFNAWEMDAGNIGTVADIRAEMLAKLRDYFMTKVFTALATVWSTVNTPTNYTQVATAITAPVLMAAIDNINNTTGGVKAVVGMRSVMTPITTFGAFWSDGNSWATTEQVSGIDSQLQKVVDEGMLGKFYGAPLIAINQAWDNPVDHTALMPATGILVIGQNVGEFITYGNVQTKQWEDMRVTPPQWNLELYQQFGLMIDNAQGIHVIRIV